MAERTDLLTSIGHLPTWGSLLLVAFPLGVVYMFVGQVLSLPNRLLLVLVLMIAVGLFTWGTIRSLPE